MSFLYIWDFCKFLFESNATQTTKIQLIKYTVVIYLASRLFISFSSQNLSLVVDSPGGACITNQITIIGYQCYTTNLLTQGAGQQSPSNSAHRVARINCN